MVGFPIAAIGSDISIFIIFSPASYIVMVNIIRVIALTIDRIPAPATRHRALCHFLVPVAGVIF